MLEENKIDIIKIMIDTMPQITDTQREIRIYMLFNKPICDDFIYRKYVDKLLMFNSLYTQLLSDLGKDIFNVLQKNI